MNRYAVGKPENDKWGRRRHRVSFAVAQSASSGTAPTITSGSSIAFTTSTAGSFTVTATGTTPLTFSETGSLPSGVTLGSLTGVLGGTPGATTGGSYPLTLTVANGTLPSATQAFTLTVNQPPAITSASSATFTFNTASSFTATATGFPVPSFSKTGALPSGVSLNASTGVLSGTPTGSGVYPITFTAANGTPPNATQSFTLTVTWGGFKVQQTYAAIADPVGIVAAQFDESVPVPDLAIAGTDSGVGKITFLDNNGDGNFGAAGNAVTFPNNEVPNSLASGEFNAPTDTHQGLVAGSSATGTIACFRGNGNLTFKAAQTFATRNNQPPAIVKVADVTGDGKPDLLYSYNGGQLAELVVCCLGNGNGTFGPSNCTVSITASSGNIVTVTLVGGSGGSGYPKSATFVLAINQGGGTDGVVTATTNSLGVVTGVTLLNAGFGYATATGVPTYAGVGSSTSVPGTYVNSMSVADLDGDGKPDLVTCGYDGSGNKVLNVLLGNGDGTFKPSVPYAMPSGNFGPILSGNVFGNGHQDIVVAAANQGSVSLFQNNGDGTFKAEVTVAVGTAAQAASLADVNGDGKPDILVLTQNGNAPGLVSVLLGNGNGTFKGVGGGCTVDVTQSGGVVTAAVLNGGGSGYPATATIKLVIVDGSGNNDATVNATTDNTGTVTSVVLTAGGTGYSTGTAVNTFVDPVYDVNDGVVAMVCSDLSGDGRPDVATAGTSYSDVSVLLNQ